MDFRIGSIATGLVAVTTTISGAIVTPSRLGVMGALSYSLSCCTVSALTLSVLKDPRQSQAAKIAALSLDFFAMLAISEATCYSMGVGYPDLARLITCGAIAVPLAGVIACFVRAASFQPSAAG